VVLCLTLVSIFDSVEGGCYDSKLCCTGKNITCRAKGPRMNSPTSRTCFCDEECLNIGDCCRDYDQICKAQDCKVGEWQRWSDCDTKCGWGKKQRKRSIVAEARHGGKECKDTKEVMSCYGWTCKHPRHNNGLQEVRETGKIIPAMYGTWRKNKLYDPYSDIRKNLFYHYRSNNIIQRPSYCAHFEVTRSTHSCHKQESKDWTRMLRRGAQICVECQPYAMKSHLGERCTGHGVFGKESRFTAFTADKCHGKWRMRTKHSDCTCNTQNAQSFIFVWEKSGRMLGSVKETVVLQSQRGEYINIWHVFSYLSYHRLKLTLLRTSSEKKKMFHSAVDPINMIM